MRRIDSELKPAPEPGDPAAPPSPPPGGRHLHLLRDDDEVELETLFRAEYDGLCDFVGRYVLGAAVAEELVQDLFLTLWRRRTMTPLAGLTRAYLYASARNAAFQYARHQRVERKWSESQEALSLAEATAPAADRELVSSEVGAAVDRAVAALPERCRLVFTLNRYHGLRHAEIAEMLGISTGTVEVQMNRALKALRHRLATFLALLLVAIR